jgi:hypothetical protein
LKDPEKNEKVFQESKQKLKKKRKEKKERKKKKQLVLLHANMIKKNKKNIFFICK